MRALLALSILAPLAAAQSKSDLAEQLKQRKIDLFFRTIEADAKLDAALKQRILGLREGARLGGEFCCIHQALLELHPAYRQADALLLKDRFAAAADAFAALRTAGDAYLAAYATFRYGLAEMNRERFEPAVEAFTAVLNQYREAGCDIEAAFYRAVCLGQVREKEEAIVAATRFLEDYPDAPERFRSAMEQMKNELLQEWESPLYDLSGRMKHVARSIDGGETGDKTQAEQAEIVAILDELIKKAEDQEGQGQGGSDGGGGAPRGNQQPNGPANRSQAPAGASRVGELRPKGKPKAGDQWGKMRDKEREEVLQALKERIPERYRELQEQYDRALAEGKRVTEPAGEAGEGK
jgi:tetratricopeptide (TPR) repeat protein